MFFNKPNHLNHQLYDKEIAKVEVKQKEPGIVGFFMFQNTKLRMSELHYTFSDNFFDIDNFEELEMDTVFLLLVLGAKEITQWIQPEENADAER